MINEKEQEVRSEQQKVEQKIEQDAKIAQTKKNKKKQEAPKAETVAPRQERFEEEKMQLLSEEDDEPLQLGAGTRV